MGYLHPSCNTDQGVKQTRKREDIVASTSLELKGMLFALVCTQELPNTDRPSFRVSLSVPVWTRKVVNYA